MSEQLALLRKPFPAHQISKLPKPYKKDSPKGNCPECGGYHGLPAMHLDYVGHAALTDRLLDADPSWTWEPLAVGEDGLPRLDGNGGLWIRLTVCGVTRIGYGDADGKTGPAAMKERIGDALRNAAMRFGAALDLWHKGELHAEPEPEPVRGMSATNLTDWLGAIGDCTAKDALDELVRDGLAAATEVKDREAFVAIRQAGKNRSEELAKVAA